jgi:RNA polymerase sigma-70 factor (ECF subfamily)
MFEDDLPRSVEGFLLPDWESIVRMHGPMAFDTAWRLLGNAADAEEVVQDALMDAFRLHAERTVINWGGLLRHLAVRRAIDRLRARPPVQPLACEPAAAESDRPEAAAIERELAERLRSAIRKLPDREASVLSLRYLGEMTNAEIASTLGITAGAVGVALHKARAKLRALLAAEPTTRRRHRNEDRA